VEWEQVLAEVGDDGQDLYDGGRDDAKAQHVIEHRPVALPLAEQFGDDGVMRLTAALEVDDGIFLVLSAIPRITRAALSSSR